MSCLTFNSKQTIDMGNRKSNKVDKNISIFNRQSENTKETGLQCLNNEAGGFTGTTGIGTVDVPLKVLPHFSSSRLGDMSLPGIDWMTSASQLDDYQNFMGAKVDNSNAQSVGNFMSSGNRDSLLFDAQDDKEKGSNNNLVDCMVQSGYPQILDGSFLTLGVGDNTEAWPKWNASRRVIIGKDGAIKTRLNQSKGKSGYENSFYPDLNRGVVSDFQADAGGFSCVEENTIGLSHLKPNFGGLSTVVQNAGISTNLSTLQNAGESFDVSFYGAAQNVNGSSLSEYNVGVSSETSSDFSLSPLPMSPMPQRRVSHSFETVDDQRFGTAFVNTDSNLGIHGHSGFSQNRGHIFNQSGLPYNQSFHGLSAESPNIVHISNQSRLPNNPRFHGVSGATPVLHSTQSGLPPNQGFHSFSGVSPILHGTTQSGVPTQVPHQMAPLPSLSSYMTSKYAKVASDQLKKHDMGSIPSFQWATSVASPALWNSKSTNNQNQSDQLFACDGSGASQVPSSVPSSRNFGIQTLEKLSATDVSASEGLSNAPSFKNIGVQSESQVIPFARGNELAMTPNALAGASLKRKAAQAPSAISQVQKRKRSVNPSIPSSLHKAQDPHSVKPFSPVASQASPVPLIAHSTSSVKPDKSTASPLPPLAHKSPASLLSSKFSPVHVPPRQPASVTPSARKSTPPHIIKWQDSELPPLSGHNCSICKRDLSYTPEGPVSQPRIAPPVAVLSCGHCFHDLCLQRITPKDQADSPPCIPCVLSEN